MMVNLLNKLINSISGSHKTMSERLGLYSQRVLTEDGLLPATITIVGNKIEDIIPEKAERFDYPIEDLGNLVLMPGLIDSHVHINEPGRTEWEGFDTATRSAAAGGITTLVDMPLNSIPVTTTAQAFEDKLNSSKGKLQVNCGFWGGVVPDNCHDLQPLIEAGVLGFKAFLIDSGIDEFGFVGEKHLRQALPVIAKNKLPLLAHAEIFSDHEGIALFNKDPTSYKAYLMSRPRKWEDDAIQMLISLCREFDCKTHIVHLSSANLLPLITEVKTQGLPLTTETCPHYLYFNAEDIPDASTIYKCAPPIRERVNNELLWKALKNGIIDFVVTDHSPSTPDLKQVESGDLAKAWGGIAGLQFSLPVFWTKARANDFTIEDVGALMSTRVAEFLDLDHQLGKIKKGYQADLMVWDPEQSFEVTEAMIQHRHKITPYLGERLMGKVERTYVGGKLVYEGGNFVNLDQGRILLRD